MIAYETWETGKEIPITYPRRERALYERNDQKCIYDQFERQVGINKSNFVEMVAKKYFEDQGYCVVSYYYLVRNRKKRERMPGFHKIIDIFGEKEIRSFIAEVDSTFRLVGKGISSGDPDLFVYNDETKECFFVEVKNTDQITDNQKILFPIIQQHLCPVFIARVKAKT